MEEKYNPTILDNFFFVLFFISQLFIIYIKRKEIWKGLCGGNGIPQPNELIKMSAWLAMNFEFALHLFFKEELDIAFLTFLGVILGISNLTSLLSEKNKKNEKI